MQFEESECDYFFGADQCSLHSTVLYGLRKAPDPAITAPPGGPRRFLSGLRAARRDKSVRLVPVSQIIRTRSRNDSNAYNLLKVYSVVSAGGPFCDNREHYFKGYVHPPPNRRSLDTRDFVVRIEGHSMEPGIPSGS